MMSMTRIFWRLAIIALALNCIPGAFAATKVTVEVDNVVDVIGDGKVDWTKQEVRARGIGLAPQYAKTPGQITALAREAAITAAERNLLKVINGVRVSSETTVEKLILTQDTIKTSVTGLLRGAVIVSEKPFGEDGYEVVMAVNLYGDKSSLSGSIDLPQQFKNINPGVTVTPNPPPAEPVAENPPARDPAESYTGLVIDCRGLGLTRSMCPRILDQKDNNVWGKLNVSAEVINEIGIAGYYKSLNDPTLAERVGKKPLVVKPLRLGGVKAFKTDAVLSTADAEFVLAANTKTGFLEKLNVAFLIDN